MGIQNKDGALYFATGIDNSGLYSGRQEAMGIIKAMAGEITAFDGRIARCQQALQEIERVLARMTR